MACYCGFETKENRVKWAVFGVCCVLAIIFFGCYLNHAIRWSENYADCMLEQNYGEERSTDEQQESQLFCQDEADKTEGQQIIVNVMLFVGFAIASSIPLYIMCCCTNKPQTYAYANPITYSKIAYHI
eukprot:TRINITY_DN2672_c0_g1_i5.p4 TRINITY_DN2672_c0_g1~~TRINITY_DN2672_c0_g1_i5.p4  ORF type:complete len:128 (+),score=9.32 TRINITY_DN2672_c0_g1_i5:732-1115(+)